MTPSSDMSWSEGAAILVLSWLVGQIALAVYNTYFHPLARFPGPRWAGATRWWKAYIEVYRGESLVDRLFELHEKYGDVVRIAPNELHFSKPPVYHEIYNSRSRWAKDPKMYRAFGDDSSTFSTLDYRSAKKRKDLIAPHFSRKTVLSMQGVIQEGLDEFCEVIQTYASDRKPVDILRAFRCLSLDNITSYCFGYSMHTVRVPGFRPPITEEMHDSPTGFHLMKHFPILRSTFTVISRLTAFCERFISVKPQTPRDLDMRNKKQIDGIFTDPDILKNAPHRLVYHSLLDPSNALKMTRDSLSDEATLLVDAGTVTVSTAATIGVLYTMNSDILDKVRAELLEVWPHLAAPPTLEVLESLPCLRAICKESLRLSQGVIAPMMRIVPPEGATIGGHSIPGGTSVGMSNLFVHLEPTLFPDPHGFHPERWLEPGAEELDTWLVAFSKGPRSCLGINLAWCELYMNLAYMFRRFDFSLGGC